MAGWRAREGETGGEAQARPQRCRKRPPARAETPANAPRARGQPQAGSQRNGGSAKHLLTGRHRFARGRQGKGSSPGGWKASPQPRRVPCKRGRQGEGQGYQPWANAPTRTTRRQAKADTQGRRGGAKRSSAGGKQARKGRDGAGCESAVEVREASRRSSSRRGRERRRRPDRPCPPQGGARHSGDWWRHQSPFCVAPRARVPRADRRKHGQRAKRGGPNRPPLF